MPSEPEKIEIRVSAEFKRSLRTLSKRYRSVRSDIQPIIERLQSGEVMGDRISGTGYAIFKVRVKNSDIQKGKSGGYRFIYYLKTSTQVLLVTLYSKSDQGDVSPLAVSKIVASFESS